MTTAQRIGTKVKSKAAKVAQAAGPQGPLSGQGGGLNGGLNASVHGGLGGGPGSSKAAPVRRARIPPLAGMPGHYIRRLQQIAVALFLEETEAHSITPVQYAALSAAQRQPGMDQRTLASSIGFDTSTIGGVIDRLERRGLIERQASADDRRVRLLVVTADGQALLQQLTRPVLKTQQRILAPLPAADRERFMAMLTTLVEANNDASRAPREDT